MEVNPQTVAVKASLIEDVDFTKVDLRDQEQVEKLARNPSDTRYSRSNLCGSKIEQDNAEREDALWGGTDPQVAVKNEKPEHRLILQLRLQGRTNREIAQTVGYSEVHVGTVLRQPWAKKFIMDEFKRQGRDSLLELLESEAENSVWKIIELRDSAKNEETQRKCANDILNRLLGSPVQPLVHTGKVDASSMSDEELYRIATQKGVN